MIRLRPLRCVQCKKDAVLGQMFQLVEQDGVLIGIVHARKCSKELRETLDK